MSIHIPKIRFVTIDPNGYCCNSCWYCPRGWTPNPRHAVRIMPLAEICRILDQCVVEGPEDPVFDPTFVNITFTHYNEMMLYPQILDVFEEVAKRNLHFSVLSSGTAIRDEHVPAIVDHINRGNVGTIILNIPAAEPDLYEQQTGISKEAFEPMIERVRQIVEAVPEHKRQRFIWIAVNTMDPRNNLRPLALARAEGKPLTAEQIDRQMAIFAEKFPGASVWNSPLFDRAGMLARLNVISDIDNYPREDEEVTGCLQHGLQWMRINPIGEAYLCFNDYEMAYVYADMTKTTIREAWLSQAHYDVVEKAFGTLCRTCISAERTPRLKGT